MSNSANSTSTDQTEPQSEGERELARVLVLLDGDQVGSMTVAALREGRVKAPARALYTLQLAGYAIDRISPADPGGHRSLQYRLQGSATPAPARLAGAREVDGDDA